MVRVKDFKKISIRGRVAYGICCLENAMEKYGISGDGWNIFLEKFWEFTYIPCELVPDKEEGVFFTLEKWFNDVVDLLPICVLGYIEKDYDELVQKNNYELPPEEIYNKIRKSYKEHSNDIINELCSVIFDIGSDELWAGIDDTSPNTLEKLQKVMDMMTENDITLPDMEPFKQYVFSPFGRNSDYHGWGLTFDGKKYSKFLK